MPAKKSTKAKAPTIAPRIVRHSVSQSRKDIADWNRARRMAQLADNPKFYLLQDIYDTITDDALLSSQINNRQLRTVAAPFELVDPQGNVNDTLTRQLAGMPVIRELIQSILDAQLYGYSVTELFTDNGRNALFRVPRQNIDPVNGRFYPDAYGHSFVPYRETGEYGRWILEFNSHGIGLLNKNVPHVLMKRFAQSCWSELCEIYGIPPRYVKTNTQDEEMLNRAETMLQEMGAAAAFVIDTTEEFQFAQGVSTNGDVYANLIRLCSNEMSMAISGAIIGQDTENGNYSKEMSSISILERLVDSDRHNVELEMNATVLPALSAIGWMPQHALSFRFASVEDPDKTWQLVKDILPYKDVDSKWLTEKFGIPVSDKPAALEPALAASTDRFFR